MASYTKHLMEQAQAHHSLLCFGLDPSMEKISPLVAGDGPRQKIVNFYSSIIDALPAGQPGVGALKPNYAYFAQYGFDGLNALKDLCDRYRGKYTLIFDGKRGDIGPSSSAYAREAFDFWGADALTISPYMGADSVQPFLERCPEGKGVYMLCRTSNAGASDFQSQDLEISQKPLFVAVSRKAVEWHVDGLGLVVGATDVDELEQVMWELEKSGKTLPLLVPGVGSQGGSASEVAKTLKMVDSARFPLHRINASSSISWAYAKKGTDDYVGAALAEIAFLNKSIGYKG
ncbi:MAG: orotidine-5'-phosphate decarboxylase [Candidatus Micrarchaeota archaeon]|nr:orotidine-5'-phosphate decarboxylase [Candidatus Micrarchaeota archaeon]